MGRPVFGRGALSLFSEGTLVDLDLNHLARIELRAMREGARKVSSRASDRVARVKAAGASSATVREEMYRAIGSDRRRATVRADGTVPLPGDPDYKGRRLAVCLAPLPVAPSLLRASGKVAVPNVDSARADSKVASAIARADGAASALHAYRARVERELVRNIRTFSKAKGPKRKALLFKIRATLLAHAGNSNLLDVARAEGWRVD